MLYFAAVKFFGYSTSHRCSAHMFYGITDISTYVLGSVFIILLPGPNSLYVMAIASRHGVAAGYKGACGIFLGDTILMLLTASGVASLLNTTPALFMLIKYVGAAYLAWIGISLLRDSVRKWRGVASNVADSIVTDASHPFRKALLISLMNPKAILFFLSFFIQFVDPHYDRPALSILILGVIIQALSVAYLSMLIFGGVYLAQQFHAHRRFSAVAIAAVGVVFIGFCLKLASATLA